MWYWTVVPNLRHNFVFLFPAWGTTMIIPPVTKQWTFYQCFSEFLVSHSIMNFVHWTLLVKRTLALLYFL